MNNVKLEYMQNSNFHEELLKVLNEIEFKGIDVDGKRVILAYFEPGISQDSLNEISRMANTLAIDLGMKCPIYLIPTSIKIDFMDFQNFILSISKDEREMMKAAIESVENNTIIVQ